MKRLIVSLVLPAMLLLSGCSGKEASSVQPLATPMPTAAPAAASTVPAVTPESSPAEAVTVDMDFSQLGETMCYAAVANMLQNAPDLLGQTVKLRGPYMAYPSGQEENRYYQMIPIVDATACCNADVEFIWDGGTHLYPDEYPPDGSTIEVTGVLSSYEEGGDTWYYLAVDDITILALPE